jgi:hypothetical protein
VLTVRTLHEAVSCGGAEVVGEPDDEVVEGPEEVLVVAAWLVVGVVSSDVGVAPTDVLGVATISAGVAPT